MTLSLELQRVLINVHGVSVDIVSSAMDGLEQELRRRLGVVTFSLSRHVDISELATAPIHVKTRIDADLLRGLIAERLVEVIKTAHQTGAD